MSAFLDGFKILLTDRIADLRASLVAMHDLAQQATNDASKKFEIFGIRCGKIEDFHQGLSHRIGTFFILIILNSNCCQKRRFLGSLSCSGSPHPEFLKAMEAEHCSKGGCDMHFTTGNYNITTTPKTEWRIVVDRDSSLADMRHHRIIPDVNEIVSRSKLAFEAGLKLFEVIAIVLYTGPMVRFR